MPSCADRASDEAKRRPKVGRRQINRVKIGFLQGFPKPITLELTPMDRKKTKPKTTHCKNRLSRGAQEQIELLELDQSGIHVAEYLTALPSQELLRQKLQSAIETARTRFDS